MESAFTAKDAARAIDSVEGLEDALRKRTLGLTWIVWGLAGPGITLSYALADETLPRGAEWAFATLWIPWVLAGYLATYALWRSAALTLREDAREGHREFRRAVLVTLALMAVAAAIAPLAVPTVPVSVYVLLVLGALTALSGALGDRSPFSAGVSRIAIGGGIFLLAAGLAAGMLGVRGVAADAIAAVAGGAAFLGMGFVATMRG